MGDLAYGVINGTIISLKNEAYRKLSFVPNQ